MARGRGNISVTTLLRLILNLPKKTTLSEKMYETTIEEDMHFLTEVVDGLTEDDVNEIMTNASELGISARYYLEEFTFW